MRVTPVRGHLRSAPRAMCAYVMMGGRCGTKGPCQHKLEPKPAASWPDTPLHVHHY